MNVPLEAQKDYEVVLAETFRTSLQALDGAHRLAVLDAIDRLQKGHGAIRVHALPPLPWVSFCVSRDAVRVICWREASTLVLAWVAMHDDAYRWARSHAPRQFGRVIRIAKVVMEDARVGAAPGPPAGAGVEAPPGPLHDVRDKVFRGLEVSARLAAVLRAVPDEDALLELCERLEPQLAEGLLALASDPDGADAAIARYHEARSAPAPTLADAVKASVNAERVWVAPPEQAAVAAALAEGGAAWSVFLHPSQKRLVTAQTSGPFLVTGGPGTGKTVVALHRARHLAATLGSAERPVLVTTFSRVLAAQLEAHMEALCRDAPDLLARVRTLTLAAAAAHVLARAGAPHALLLGEDVDAAWSDALAADALDLGRAFYASEREDVVLAHGVETEEQYLRVVRAGRGARLDRAKKRRVWAVLAAFEAALARRGGDDAGGLARRAATLLRDGAAPAPFAAVICDEVQDASRWQLHLLAALAAAATPGAASPGPDRLFLVGDGHQRLYERPVSLRSCGIEVRGRSARLRLNYRTTQGICAAALDALAGVGLDVLERDVLELERAGDADALRAPDAAPDDAADAQAPIGYRSLRAGARPSAHAFASADAEADFIVGELRAKAARPFLVLARTRTMLASIAERLRQRGVSPVVLGDGDVMPDGDHVVLATLHRSKGLEAPHVILAGMHESPLRFTGGSADERALHARKERLLVYVGMTRARDTCAITKITRAHPSG